MITYEQGHWAILFALRLRGSVFPKSFCWGFPSAVLAIGLHILLHDYWAIQRKTVETGTVGASVLSGFTFVLGFLIVFRSQQAYARWWEGGTLLQQLRGEWFNAFSSLLAFCNSKKEKAAEVQQFQHRLVRLVSLLYASALEQVTTIHNPHLEVIELDGFELDNFVFMKDAHDRCEVVLQWIQRLIVEADDLQVITVAPPILSRVYNQLGNGIVNLNNARKITDFPIPFPLAQMVTFMLLCHFFITIIVTAASVETPAWAGFLAFLVVFSFWSINYIAIELEMPFGDDPNDLPLAEMQTDLNRSLMSLMEPSAQTCPTFHFKPVHKRFKRTETHLDEYLCELSPELFPHPSQVEREVKRESSFRYEENKIEKLGKKISMRMLNASQYTKKLEANRAKRKGMLTRLSQTPFSSILTVLSSPSNVTASRSGKSTEVLAAAGQTLQAKDKDIDTEERIGASRSSTEASQQKESRQTNVKFSESTNNLESLRDCLRENLVVPQNSAQTVDASPAHVAVQVAPVELVSHASPQRDAGAESQQRGASSSSLALEQVSQARPQRDAETDGATPSLLKQDAIWRSMEEHLCQIARELQALRGTDVDRIRPGPIAALPERHDTVLGRQSL